MNNPFEQQWAVALKKTQQQIKRQQTGTTAKNLARAIEDMAFYKTQLYDAALAKDARQMEHTLKKLIDLRAEQAALQMEQWRRSDGSVSKGIIERYTEQYMHDCLKLIDATAGNLP